MDSYRTNKRAVAEKLEQIRLNDELARKRIRENHNKIQIEKWKRMRRYVSHHQRMEEMKAAAFSAVRETVPPRPAPKIKSEDVIVRVFVPARFRAGFLKKFLASVFAGRLFKKVVVLSADAAIGRICAKAGVQARAELGPPGRNRLVIKFIGTEG